MSNAETSSCTLVSNVSFSCKEKIEIDSSNRSLREIKRQADKINEDRFEKKGKVIRITPPDNADDNADWLTEKREKEIVTELTDCNKFFEIYENTKKSNKDFNERSVTKDISELITMLHKKFISKLGAIEIGKYASKVEKGKVYSISREYYDELIDELDYAEEKSEEINQPVVNILQTESEQIKLYPALLSFCSSEIKIDAEDFWKLLILKKKRNTLEHTIDYKNLDDIFFKNKNSDVLQHYREKGLEDPIKNLFNYFHKK
jgi:hypothetical protein